MIWKSALSLCKKIPANFFLLLVNVHDVFKVSVFFPRQHQKHEMVLVFAIKNKENIFLYFFIL
jgi:hypothetical protein